MILFSFFNSNENHSIMEFTTLLIAGGEKNKEIDSLGRRTLPKVLSLAEPTLVKIRLNWNEMLP